MWIWRVTRSTRLYNLAMRGYVQTKKQHSFSQLHELSIQNHHIQGKKTKQKKNYVGRGNSPNIDQGKGDVLAQKSRNSVSSLPPQSRKQKG
eukprot:1141316-Pelagomonas_calceolata.AAC.1